MEKYFKFIAKDYKNKIYKFSTLEKIIIKIKIIYLNIIKLLKKNLFLNYLILRNLYIR